MTSRRKTWLLAILGLVVVVAALVAVKAAQIGSMIKAGKSFVPPPETVSSATVERTDWTPTRAAIGSVVAIRGVQLGAELPGMVRDITFDSGSAVRAGAVLVRLDTSTEEAQLAAARADARLARIALERAQVLRQAGSNAQADLDAAEARAKAADANVRSLEATIAKKTIRAPFDGRVSIRQVELGQVLSPGAAIASLASVTPIFVDFWLPQQALADIAAGQKVKVSTDAYPGAAWEGEVATVNTEVDPATRNVRFRARVPNADGRLRPGMFANVEVIAPQHKQVLLVPATAVLFAPYGDSVFVIEQAKDQKPPEGAAAPPPGQPPPPKDGLVVRQRFIRTAERRGDYVAVESGLQAGERIVSTGAFKLRNGMAVVVNDAVAPKPEATPRPQDR